MFDKFKAMGAMAALLKDKDKIKAAGGRIKDAAAEIRATGEGGGGAVRVTVDGRMKVLAVDLQPALAAGMAADDRTRELAGNVIAEAVNAAMAAAQLKMKVVLEKEAKELGLPELPMDVAGMLS
jgi:nucleoid-associated protein EbfC